MALATLGLDLITKVLVVAELRTRQPVELFGGLVYLTHARNTGAAFSVGEGFTVVLSVLAVAVVVVLLVLARRLVSPAWAAALGLIAGGAAGNLIDRLFRSPGPLEGAVVDFISVLDPVDPPWPVFNLADSALVVGVALVVVLELFGKRPGLSPRGVKSQVPAATAESAAPPETARNDSE